MRYDFAGEDYSVDFTNVIEGLQADFTAFELGVIFNF